MEKLDEAALLRKAMVDAAARSDAEVHALEEELVAARKKASVLKKEKAEIEEKEREARRKTCEALAEVEKSKRRLRETEAERDEAREMTQVAREDAEEAMADAKNAKAELEVLQASALQSQILREKIASLRQELEEERDQARGAIEEAERAREQAHQAYETAQIHQEALKERDSLLVELQAMKLKAKEAEDLASVAHAEVAQLLEALNALRAASTAATDEAALQSASATEAVISLEKRLRATREELRTRNLLVEELQEEIEELKSQLYDGKQEHDGTESVESERSNEEKVRDQEAPPVVDQLKSEIRAWSEEAAAKQREIERYVELCEKLTRANKALRRQNATLASNTPQAIAMSTPRRVLMAGEVNSPLAPMLSLENLTLSEKKTNPEGESVSLDSTKTVASNLSLDTENLAPLS